MKRLLLGALVVLLCVPLNARRDTVDVTLDKSEDPVYSDTVMWYGGQGGMLVPTRVSSVVTLQTSTTDSGIGAFPLFDGIAEADYKLRFYCAVDADGSTLVPDASETRTDFACNTTTDMISDTAGVGGYAYDFDGLANTFFTHADHADFDVSTATSVAIGFWFKHDTIASAADVLFNKRDGSGNTETGYMVQMESDGDLTYWESDDGGATKDFVTTTATYDDNAWHHAMVWRDGTSAGIYVDGASVTTVALSQSTGTLENAGAVNIGAVTTTTNVWAGHVDSMFFISGDIPTAAEVKDYYDKSNATYAAVKTLTSTSAATTEYVDFLDYLTGYYGYVRFVYGAAQTADETITLHYSR